SHLRADTAQVDDHLIAPHLDANFDGHVLADVHAVVVHEGFRFVNAIGNVFYCGTGDLFALVENFLHALLERLNAVALQELDEAAIAANDRGELVILAAPFKDLYERHLQTFGENIARDRAQDTADILPMTHRRGKSDELAVVKYWQGKNHVI